MKLARLTSLALAAALVIPAAAQAQYTEFLHFGGVKTPGGDAVGGAETGPYVALRTPFATPANAFDIYCLDIDHTAQSQWTTRYLTFQEATGVYNLQATRQLGSEKSWGIAELRAAAYLTTQFSSKPLNQWDEVHGSIWSMFSNNGAAASHNSLVASALSTAGGDAAWDSYLLMVDNKVFAADYDTKAYTINQGFLVDDSENTIRVVPEPSTYMLMGVGLFAVGFVSRRRRNNA